LTEIACAVFAKNGLVLLVKRSPHKAYYPNQWDLVGGHVEPGESVEAALVREAQEEVGLTPLRFHRLTQFSEMQAGDGLAVRYHVYAVTEWNGGEPRLLGDEHTAMRWVKASDVSTLDDIAHPQYARVFSELVAV